MSNELWNLHATRAHDASESDFDTVTEWAADHIVSIEAALATANERIRELEAECAESEEIVRKFEAQMLAEMKIGGRYNWKGQPERLVYLGRNWSGNGYWNQFAKVEYPSVVWCEVLDSHLDMIEETTPTNTEGEQG